MSGEVYRITVAVRKRDDLDVPSSLDEALSMVNSLLAQGSMLTVLAVEPEAKQTKDLRFG